MADPFGHEMSEPRPGSNDHDPTGDSDRRRRDFQTLAAACRTLAVAGPAQAARISVSLPAGDDLDGPDALADMALSLAAAHGFEVRVEIGRGWVTAYFSRREEGS